MSITATKQIHFYTCSNCHKRKNTRIMERGESGVCKKYEKEIEFLKHQTPLFPSETVDKTVDMGTSQ